LAKPKDYTNKVKSRLDELEQLHESQPLLGDLATTGQPRTEIIILTMPSEKPPDYLVDIHDG
jgi:hypothetical protein